MPHQTDPHDGFEVLDDDLLAALDDVLSFSEQTTMTDAFATTDSATLVEEFDSILSIEIPPLLSAEEQAVAVTTSATDKPAKPAALNRSGSGRNQQQTPSIPGKKGKDVRTAPYSKANKPRRRKRPKDEIDYLRAKVTDMEEELAALTEPEVGSPRPSAPIVSVESSHAVLLCWKKIAERQKMEADRSVVENLRLRAMLEGQLKVAKSLEAAIDQHQREAAQSLPTSEMTTEASLLLEAQYAELDTVFELSGIAHVNYDMNNGTKAHHDASGVSIRHEEVRLLPFSMEAVHRAMWGILRYSTAKDMMLGPFQTQVVDDNRMNVTMIEKIALGKSQANIVRRFSFRRVFEKNRTVVIWSSYVEMDGSVFVRLREKGYSTSSSFNFGAGVPGSVTRMAVLASPEMTVFASPEEQKAHIGEMTELMVGTYRVSMGLIHQIIDTLCYEKRWVGRLSKAKQSKAPWRPGQPEPQSL
ncbi:hypothetical protein PInf_002863 [Phytophthora infestans]|nr:hypothetical protein PInf_002863 [Phytophthora infestans]